MADAAGQVVAIASRAEARQAGLRYTHDGLPGIRRRRDGDSFRYVDETGAEVEDAETIARIKAIAIPPAWEDVWICPSSNGHLQATGRDARGRKQYRYHPDWRRSRDETKFSRMEAFGATLPRIRARVTSHLARRRLTRERVLATIVALMDEAGMRVGNEEYARTNGSYGLTTLRNRHADVHSSHVVFSFTGKSGKQHRVDVRDPRLARVVRQCRDLPGYELFEYLDEDGEVHDVGSEDVNAYLRDISGHDFTAKDFRTWRATVLAAAALRQAGPAASRTAATRAVNQAVGDVAAALGNTPAVCRKSYIHPAVLDAYLEGVPTTGSPPSRWLSADERATLACLRAARPSPARRAIA